MVPIHGHQIPCPESVGGPEAVRSRTAAPTKPEHRVVVEVFRLVQPAAFIEMMSRRTANRVVLSGPGDFRQEFGNHKYIGRALDMFSIGPPSEVIRPLHILV